MLYLPPLAKTMVFGLLTAILYVQPAAAQNPSFQDCLGAIPVCQQIYQENKAPAGNGNIIDFEATDNCTVGERNSIWYTFTVNNSGKFGFLLTPNNLDQDYDWVLYDVTNANCDDLLNNPSLVVSCNAAGNTGCLGATGATGDTEYDEQGPECNNFPPSQNEGFSPFNDLVDVTAGNVYLLCVINFSSVSSEGYVLDFGLSEDIGIFDEIPPALDTITYPTACNGETISVQFSEYIQCATINESNFQLSGPDGPLFTTLSSANCDAGGKFSKEFFLTVVPPIPPGASMDLALVVDGSTEALDLCGNPSAPVTLSFTGPSLNESLNLGPDTTLCAGGSLLLDGTTPGATYLWQDGSSGPTLNVSAAGTYWLELTTDCGSTRDTVVVSVLDTDLPAAFLGNDTTLCAGGSLLLDGTTPGATYLWQDGSSGPTLNVSAAGTYWLELTTDCGSTRDTVVVSVLDTDLPAAFLGNDTTLCAGGSLLLDGTTPGATYLWQDGSSGPTLNVSAAGTYWLELTTDCGSTRDTVVVSVADTNLPVAVLGNDTTLCPGTSLLLDAMTPGASYLWQDGNTGSTLLVDQPGSYTVTLVNECGEIQDSITVGFTEPIGASLNDATLCPGESINFDVSIPGGSYLWQDGSTGPTYTVTSPGNYSVTVRNACEELALSAVVQETAAPIPVIDLGNDTTLCPGESLLLDLNIPDVMIIWQDGTEGSRYQVETAGTYTAEVSNDCESRSGSIQVNTLGPITVDLVQDTVLCPGESLLLDVTNANAATYSWQDNTTDAVYTVREPGVYTVVLANTCEEVSAGIRVAPCETCNVYVPNAFSPNGDGMNDSFKPYLNCPVEKINLKVFNRWGNLVYEGNSIENGWDGMVKGQQAEMGVYLYFLELSIMEEGNRREMSFSGDVTVTY